MQDIRVSPKVLSKLLKKMRIQNDSVLVIKSGTELTNMESLASLKDAISGTGLKNIIIIVADDLDDVRALNPIEMQRAGWFRSDIIKKLSAKARQTPQVVMNVGGITENKKEEDHD